MRRVTRVGRAVTCVRGVDDVPLAAETFRTVSSVPGVPTGSAEGGLGRLAGGRLRRGRLLTKGLSVDGGSG